MIQLIMLNKLAWSAYFPVTSNFWTREALLALIAAFGHLNFPNFLNKFSSSHLDSQFSTRCQFLYSSGG